MHNALHIASQLIAIDTTSKKGVEEATQWLKQWAKSHQLQVTHFQGTKALLIETSPLAKKHLSFVTHLDVVPANEWPFAFTPKVDQGYLIGRGAVDDKGPLAVCLEVLLMNRSTTHINISCLIVTDEETTNQEIQAIINSKKFQPDFCIVADGGTHALFDIGQKGVIRLTAKTKAKGGHSAFEEREHSAALLLYDFIWQLDEFGRQLKYHSNFKPAFINISSFSTQAVPYGLPSSADANLEIQFPPPQTVLEWQSKIRQLKSKVKHLSVAMHFIQEPHLLTQTKWRRFLKLIPKTKCVTVGSVNLSKDLNLAHIPAVGHCPVTTYVAHCDNERIKITDLTRGVKFYQKIVKLFSDELSSN